MTEWSKKKARLRRYSAATVIRTQKRVLHLALNTIGRMSHRQRLTLRTCGDGLITLNELTDHIAAAIRLKVRPTRHGARGEENR